MLIAVMSDQAGLSGRVPDRFETSPALLLIETNDGRLMQAFSGESAADYAARIAACGCEAVVCGIVGTVVAKTLAHVMPAAFRRGAVA